MQRHACFCISLLNLAADSPKIAFYRIRIEADVGIFTIFKENGIQGRVLDQQACPHETLDQARKLYDR